MSKAIYKPKGKAGEYAEWACNLYVGCSNNCSYCYCKKGLLSHAMGGPEAKLKACFKDEAHAYEVFKKELLANLEDLRKSSLFFTFSSDPMISETRWLTNKCIQYAIENGVKVQVLTKNAEFLYDSFISWLRVEKKTDMVAYGFTLTGRDDMEPGASTNYERIEAMEVLHNLGFRTFASLEPVIRPALTTGLAKEIAPFCDLVKVGLMSGVPLSYYKADEVIKMVSVVKQHCKNVYFKRSITEALGLPAQNPIDIFKIERV